MSHSADHRVITVKCLLIGLVARAWKLDSGSDSLSLVIRQVRRHQGMDSSSAGNKGVRCKLAGTCWPVIHAQRAHGASPWSCLWVVSS